MKVLITGGAGFIGSHISKQLLDQGHQVVIYDSLVKSQAEAVDNRAELVQADINDSAKMKDALAGCEVVIHMASLMEVGESVKDPVRYAENNIIGGVKLLEAMREVGVKKVIFSSSATVYGNPRPDQLPLTEDQPV